MLWLTSHQRRERSSDGARDERLSAHEVTLLLAVPSIDVALREELDDLGLTLPPSSDGYHLVERAMLPLVVIDLGAVAEREDDDVLRAFAGHRVRTLAARQWMRQHQTLRSDAMGTQATPDPEGYKEFVAFMLDGLTPEEKMMGLAPEQRLAGLPESEQVLAMSDALLRVLPESYIASLPADVQAKVRARLAR